MATPMDAEALLEIVRHRHVHYDVEPELSLRGTERVLVGMNVRLWAVHPRGAGALPGCSACIPLVEELRRVADAVVPPARDEATFELEPFRPALYVSSVVSDADEVALTIHLRSRDGLERPVDAAGGRCLRELRARLGALGIPEQ